MRVSKQFLKIAALVLLATPTPGTAAAGDGPPFGPEDIFGLTQASEPQITRDGRTVAYLRLTNDAMIDDARKEVWLLDIRTGTQHPIGGAGSGSAAQPRWCADGRRLAFTADPEHQPRGLFVYTVATRRIARVATLPAAASALSWSPDCARIAFVMHVGQPEEALGALLAKPAGAQWAKPIRFTTRARYRVDGKGDLPPGYDHLFVTPAAGGTPRQITTGPFDDGGPISWAPDGRWLVFTGHRDADWEINAYRTAIFRVAADGGAPVRLTRLDGPAASASVSPDGRSIAFSGYDDRRRRPYENRLIYLMDADGGHVRPAHAAIDRSLDAPAWAADGHSLFAGMEDRGVKEVVRFAPGGPVVTVAEGLADTGLDLPYDGGSFTVAADGTVVFPQGAPDHPGDVALARDGSVRRLTRLNDPLLGRRSLGALTPLSVRAADGTPIGAWMLTPPHFDPARRYPLILEIHGGPFLSYGPYFSTDDQLYAAAGYVVVYGNARGSTSYGEAFADAVNRDYPGVNYGDEMSVVDAAIARGFVDPHRLFVTGGSAGGIMTAWIVGRTDRFRAAAAQRPAVNWTSLTLTSDSGYKTITNWIGKAPWEAPAFYWAHSPLSLVGNVTTPTLVVVGERDIRTPIDEAEQLYGALQFRGVPTGLLRVPDAFHDMAARPSHAAAKTEAIIAWFDRYGGKP